MTIIEQIDKCIPASRRETIPWKAIEQLFSETCFRDMQRTAQNPIFHGEGDVYTHTQMVCQKLIEIPRFQVLLNSQKTELFLAAILHDIGKTKTTRSENGEWVSPHHASVGSQLVREFLWKECGLCGTIEKTMFRETVCALVRYHMLAMHLINQENAIRKAREVAAIAELAPDFSWNLLCMLAEADVKGRIADDIEDSLSQLQLSRIVAEEAGCLCEPYAFADSFTKHAYLCGRNVQPNQMLYDDTWGEVIMLSGLPGTGKDTWILQNKPDLPVVSLDEIREETQSSPVENQGKIIQKAQERARAYLRSKQPFIWNATDLSKDLRQKQVSLFERYGAKVRIVYLETDWNTRKSRNSGRKDAVPEHIVEKMLGRTVLPTSEEAQTVEWVFV